MPVSADSAVTPFTVVFLGDSLTAGYGLPENKSFTSLLAERARAISPDIKVVNGGVSGDTSAGGVRRVDWLIRGGCDIFVLELGANDGLRGLPPAEMQRNLKEIVFKVRKANPDAQILLLGMLAPPNLGETYSRDFAAAYQRVAEVESVEFVPFLLNGVAGVAALNQNDAIHPNEAGARIVADTVWSALRPMIERGIDTRNGHGKPG